MLNLNNLKHDALYKIVFKEIRNYIVSNKLAPGARLPTEMEMCAMMGVSRNVIRESLIALQMMGIIKPVAGIGNVILDFSVDYIFENIMYNLIRDTKDVVYDIRQIRGYLEMAFFEEAFNLLEKSDIEDLDKAFKFMQEKVNAAERASEEDMQFHYIIFRHVGNVMFHSFIKVSWHLSRDLSKLKNYIKDKEDSLENHRLILQAIQSRDYHAARRQIELHYSDSTNEGQ